MKPPVKPSKFPPPPNPGGLQSKVANRPGAPGPTGPYSQPKGPKGPPFPPQPADRKKPK